MGVHYLGSATLEIQGKGTGSGSGCTAVRATANGFTAGSFATLPLPSLPRQSKKRLPQLAEIDLFFDTFSTTFWFSVLSFISVFSGTIFGGTMFDGFAVLDLLGFRELELELESA